MRSLRRKIAASPGRVDPEERADAVSTRTGSLRSSAAPREHGRSTSPAPGSRAPAPRAQEEEDRMRQRLAAGQGQIEQLEIAGADRGFDLGRPEPLRGV